MFFKRLFVFVVVFSLGALMVHAINDTPIQDLRIPVFFWSMMLALWVLYYAFIEGPKGKLVKELHPLVQYTISFCFILLAFFSVYGAVVLLFNDDPQIQAVTKSDLRLMVFFCTLLAAFTVALLKFVNIVGARQFLPFLVGTYYTPVQREKVVMFVDMVGSSFIAEKLDPIQAQKFIAKFIFDISSVIRRSHGEVVNFTGDGLVALWRIRSKRSALDAVEKMYAEMESERKHYVDEFGFVPDFRVGIHAGSVVISQIGEEKLFLGLYGDVVNTAARLEALNKDLGTRTLISKCVLTGSGLEDSPRIVSKGELDIRGRESKVHAFELKTSSDN
jgi:class 3 adenylate cyclase